MSLKVAELKKTRKELQEQEAKIKAQIHHIDGLISAMSRAPGQTKGNGMQSNEIPFPGAVRAVFEANGNTPTKRAHVLKQIMAAHKGLTTSVARNKFTYLIRIGFVAKKDGKYIWANKVAPIFQKASVQPDDWELDEQEPSEADIEAAGDRYIQQQADIIRGK